MASGGLHPDIARFLSYNSSYDITPDGEDLTYGRDLHILALIASIPPL